MRERALAIALAEPLIREVHDIVLYQHDGEVSISLHLKLPAETELETAHEVADASNPPCEASRAYATYRRTWSHLKNYCR